MESSDVSQVAASVQKEEKPHLNAGLHQKSTELILGTGRKS